MNNESLFRDAPVWKAIAVLTVPSVLTILIMVVYNLADMLFIGMLGEDIQVAAVAVVSPVFSLANALATMIGAGGCTVIARTLGKGDRSRAVNLFSLCIWASVVLGALFGILLLAGRGTVLAFLGSDTVLSRYAGPYMSILAVGAPFMLFSITMASAVRAEGIILPGMMANIAGTVVNLVLDPLFILGFHLGIRGAAAATVMGNVTSCIWMIAAIRRHSRLITFSPSFALKEPALLGTILFTGLPNGISTVLSGFASTFSNRLLSTYSAGAIAANAAAGRAVLIITMVQMGICIGVSPMLAYNCGSGSHNRLKAVLTRTALLAFGFGTASSLLCFAMRTEIIGLFLKDAENLALGVRMMLWLTAAGPFIGLYYLSTNFLQACGKPAAASFLSLLRQGILLIPALFVLNRMYGIIGIAAAHLAADAGSIIIAVLCAGAGFRALRRTEEHDTAVKQPSFS